MNSNLNANNYLCRLAQINSKKFQRDPVLHLNNPNSNNSKCVLTPRDVTKAVKTRLCLRGLIGYP